MEYDQIKNLPFVIESTSIMFGLKPKENNEHNNIPFTLENKQKLISLLVYKNLTWQSNPHLVFVDDFEHVDRVDGEGVTCGTRLPLRTGGELELDIIPVQPVFQTC